MNNSVGVKERFKHRLSEYVAATNHIIDLISTVRDLPQKSVYEAMRYSITAGGKRIRPVITMAVTEMLDGDVNTAAAAAAAIECIHTYSLIHDDLPCMDDDDLRRGRPTCHKAFPESTALLAGDGLLNLAFELLSCQDYMTLEADVRLNLISALASASGTNGMIGGQIIDLESEGRDDVTMEELTNLHRLKTGELISVSAEFGCILCGLHDESDERLVKIRDFSAKLGLAFQIKDDILDITGDAAVLGKPIGSDADCGKVTFVTLLGLDGAENKLNSLTAEAVFALDIFGDRAWFLKELANVLLTRDK